MSDYDAAWLTRADDAVPARHGNRWDHETSHGVVVRGERHRIGNFAKIGKCGAIAGRYDKTDTGHAACRRLAAAMIAIR